MGWKMTEQIYRLKVAKKFDLKPAEREVLAYIAHRVNDKTGRCYFKQTTMESDTSLKVTSISRASKKLVEKGLIERELKGVLYHYKLKL